jgi:F-type H+-transporting ATPase subunit b
LLLFGFAESPIQLVPDGTIIFHLAVIIIMVALLNATLLKPINRILEEREQLTKGRLSQAQAILLKADQEIREYERTLREARSEGYALMEQERAAVAREREQMLADVRAEVSREVAAERAKLRTETQQVKLNLQQGARSIAIEISRQILGRPIIERPNDTKGAG